MRYYCDPFVRASFSVALQASLLSKKVHSVVHTFGGVAKHYGVVLHSSVVFLVRLGPWAENRNQRCTTRKQERCEFRYPDSSAEIQASATDTRTQFGYPPLRRSFCERLGNFLDTLGWSERRLCVKTWPLANPVGPYPRTPPLL